MTRLARNMKTQEVMVRRRLGDRRDPREREGRGAAMARHATRRDAEVIHPRPAPLRCRSVAELTGIGGRDMIRRLGLNAGDGAGPWPCSSNSAMTGHAPRGDAQMVHRVVTEPS